MRQSLPNHLLHNPFYNRFNVPVTHRHDEMQAQAYVWLRDRNEGEENRPMLYESNRGRKLFGVFAMVLMVIVTVLILLKAF
jgi:hypothetical protein